MNEKQVSSNGDRWVVDEYTGELYEYREVIPQYQQPIDISTITSLEAYQELLTQKIGGRKFKLQVSPLLLDVVVDKVLTIPAISLFCLLGQKIGYNTIVYTSVGGLVKETGYVRQTVSLALSELKDKGFVKEPDVRLNRKGDRLLLVSPLYFFLGHFYNRDNCIKDWFC